MYDQFGKESVIDLLGYEPNDPVGYPIFNGNKIYIFISKDGNFYKLHRVNGRHEWNQEFAWISFDDSNSYGHGVFTAEEQIRHAVIFGEIKIFTSLESFIFWMHNKITE